MQEIKPSPTCQVICVCLWACGHLFPHAFVWVVAWMWPHGGEVNWHTPEDDRGGTWSDLFKTHTIWVARLQAWAETTVSVSEVKRKRKETKRGENLRIHNFQFSISALYIHTKHTHAQLWKLAALHYLGCHRAWQHAVLSSLALRSLWQLCPLRPKKWINLRTYGSLQYSHAIYK